MFLIGLFGMLFSMIFLTVSLELMDLPNFKGKPSVFTYLSIAFVLLYVISFASGPAKTNIYILVCSFRSNSMVLYERDIPFECQRECEFNRGCNQWDRRVNCWTSLSAY